MMVNQWRAFLDFGTGGSLGDWGVHILGPAHLALQLTAPTSVEAVTVEGRNQWNWPSRAHIRFEFPARGTMPPVAINFYQNMRGDAPMPEGMEEGERLLPPSNNLAERGRPAPPDSFGGRGAGRGAAGAGRANAAGGRGTAAAGGGAAGARAADPNRVPGNGALFVGDKGYMATTSRGEGVWLLPGFPVEGIQPAAADPAAVGEPSAGLGAGLQGRTGGVLGIQRSHTVYRMAGAGGDRAANPGQAPVGREGRPVHQQRRGEPDAQALYS